jgi:hypothetical protein
MVIEPDGARHFFEHDRTAVWLYVRNSDDFAAGSLPGARNLPASGLRPGKDQGEVKATKDDGRLPVNDHNTRIIVFGEEPPGCGPSRGACKGRVSQRRPRSRARSSSCATR